MKIQNEDILLIDALLSRDTDDIMKIRTLKENKDGKRVCNKYIMRTTKCSDIAQHKVVFCVSSFEDNNVDNINNIFSKIYEIFN